MRNELLQERASRQDLECDKIALERQVHTLLSGGAIHTITHQSHDDASANSFHPHLVFIFIGICPFCHQFPSDVFKDMALLNWENNAVTSLSMTSAEQRPEEQIVSPGGLPEVQQREPGSPAGGPNTGAGGEARRGGKVRQQPPVGSKDEVHCG